MTLEALSRQVTWFGVTVDKDHLYNQSVKYSHGPFQPSTMQKVKLWIDLDSKISMKQYFFSIRFEMFKGTDNIGLYYIQWRRWPGTQPVRPVRIVRDEMHQFCRKRHWKSLMIHYIKGNISQKQFKISIWIKDLFNTDTKSRGFVMKIGALTNRQWRYKEQNLVSKFSTSIFATNHWQPISLFLCVLVYYSYRILKFILQGTTKWR